MAPKTQTIEVDDVTADVLRGRAAAQGLSVSELVADMTALSGAPVALSRDDLAETDRRWMAVQAGETTVPHEDVGRWLQSWGTPSFKPWHEK